MEDFVSGQVRWNYTKLRNYLMQTVSTEEKNIIVKCSDIDVNIVAGLQEDMNILMQNFFDKKSTKYEDFVTVWKEMKFELIFCGRPSLPEMYEFMEGALNLAAEYLLIRNPNDNYVKCIFGLYLVYSLKNAHRVGQSAHVRVPPNAVFVLRELKIYASKNGLNYVLYILCSLLRDGTFRFVATPREYGVERCFTKYIGNENELGLKREENADDGSVLNSFYSQKKDLLNDVATALDYYKQTKLNLPGTSDGVLPKELDYIDGDFATKLTSTIKSFAFENPFQDDSNEPRAKRTTIRKRKIAEGNEVSKSKSGNRAFYSSLSYKALSEKLKDRPENSNVMPSTNTGNVDLNRSMPTLLPIHPPESP